MDQAPAAVRQLNALTVPLPLAVRELQVFQHPDANRVVHLQGKETLAQARAPPPEPDDATQQPDGSLLRTEVVVALEGGEDLTNELARDKPAVMEGALESNCSFSRIKVAWQQDITLFCRAPKI